MNKFKAMKFNIGDDPELSEVVQKLLFGLGYSWYGDREPGVQITDKACLFADDDGIITYLGNVDAFDEYDNEEIDINWLRSLRPAKHEIVIDGKTIEISEKSYKALKESLK